MKMSWLQSEQSGLPVHLGGAREHLNGIGFGHIVQTDEFDHLFLKCSYHAEILFKEANCGMALHVGSGDLATFYSYIIVTQKIPAHRQSEALVMLNYINRTLRLGLLTLRPLEGSVLSIQGKSKSPAADCSLSI